MNWDLFKKWFTEMLLPNIPENCLIIMDIEQLDSGFEKVTAKTCARIIAKVRKIEDEFWTEDLEFDAQEFGLN